MPMYCPRCGYRELDDPRLCWACMDGEADPARAMEILTAAEAGNRDALRMLAEIDDARAVGVMLTAARHPQSDIRRAALTSLAATRDPRAEPLALDALRDADERVRAAVVACLAELGGKMAADALATQLAHPPDGTPAATALAWLRDERAVEPLLAAIDQPRLSGNAYRSVGSALGWLADPRTVPPLVHLLNLMTDRWITSQQVPAGLPPRPDWGAHMVATDVVTALGMIGGAEADAAVAQARERFGGELRYSQMAPLSRPFAYRATRSTTDRAELVP